MYRKAVGLVMVVAALAGVPATVQAASSTVSIAVPLTQQLDGTTAITLAPGATVQPGRLVVKSNVPWMLVARTGDASGVIWNGASSRQQLGVETVVARGTRGVHIVTFEVQRTSQDASVGLPVQVTFSVEPAR